MPHLRYIKLNVCFQGRSGADACFSSILAKVSDTLWCRGGELLGPSVTVFVCLGWLGEPPPAVVLYSPARYRHSERFAACRPRCGSPLPTHPSSLNRRLSIHQLVRGTELRYVSIRFASKRTAANCTPRSTELMLKLLKRHRHLVCFHAPEIQLGMCVRCPWLACACSTGAGQLYSSTPPCPPSFPLQCRRMQARSSTRSRR